MESTIYDLILDRRSVRTFDGRPLSADDRAEIEKLISEADNPFDDSAEFMILDSSEHKLRSPVIVGCDTYIAGKCRKDDTTAALGFGYALESLMIKAWRLGIGSVWLAGTIDRPAFEKAAMLKTGEVLPAVSPLGYAADKQSLREKMMRSGLKADERISFEELFFRNDFSHGLTPDEAGIFEKPLNAMRLAPSAANKQPWRAIVCADKVHFYKKRSIKGNSLGDIQTVDMGIGLAHFKMLADETGLRGHFSFDEPSIPVEADTEYIASFEVD